MISNKNINNNKKKNFNEQNEYISFEDIIKEADRCLQCINPSCIKGCPIKINIPKFISFIKKRDLFSSYKVIFESNVFPSICGRVCQQENQCEFFCILNRNCNKPIKIGLLERYISDSINIKKKLSLLNYNNKVNKKIAIVGSGPSSLSISFYLKRYGYNIIIFEALNKIGGVLSYGIPNFRLRKRELNLILKQLDYMNIKVYTNYVIGKNKTIDELSSEYDAVFIGTGAGTPKFLNIEGEYLNNIYSANEYLSRINLMVAYKEKYSTPIKKGNDVVIIGGGNVAIDSARCALRLGSKNVTILYRRTENELSARKEEIKIAKKEGIQFKYLLTPKRFLSNEKHEIKTIVCKKMKKTNTLDANEKYIYEEIDDSECYIKSDLVIIAIGTIPNKLVFKDSSINLLNTNGTINVNNNLQYLNTNVFFGGDIVTGTATVISAIEHGKRAADSINTFLNKK